MDIEKENVAADFEAAFYDEAKTAILTTMEKYNTMDKYKGVFPEDKRQSIIEYALRQINSKEIKEMSKVIKNLGILKERKKHIKKIVNDIPYKGNYDDKFFCYAFKVLATHYVDLMAKKEASEIQIYNEYKKSRIANVCWHCFEEREKETNSSTATDARRNFMDENLDFLADNLNSIKEKMEFLNKTLNELCNINDNTQVNDLFPYFLEAAMYECGKEDKCVNIATASTAFQNNDLPPLLPPNRAFSRIGLNINEIYGVIPNGENFSFKNHTKNSTKEWCQYMCAQDKIFILLWLEKRLNIQILSKFPDTDAFQKIHENHDNNKIVLKSEFFTMDFFADSQLNDFEYNINCLSKALTGKKMYAHAKYINIESFNELKKKWNVVMADQTEEIAKNTNSEYEVLMQIDKEIQSTVAQNTELKFIQSYLKDKEKFSNFLRAVLQIHIRRNGKSDATDKQLFDIKIDCQDAYNQLVQSLRRKTEKSFSKEYIDQSKLDFLIGKLSQKPSFYNEFEKAIVHGWELASEYDQKFVDPLQNYLSLDDDIVKEILKSESVEDGDHRKLNLILIVFCAITVLESINRILREKVIKELCEYADNFDSKNRKQQECAVMILTYFLYRENPSTNLSFELKKKVFESCFSKHLYPFQVELYKDMVVKDKLYSEFPKAEFDKFLSGKQPQPKYFLLQQLCRGNGWGEISTKFLKDAIIFQDLVWIDSLGLENSKVNELANNLINHIAKAQKDDTTKKKAAIQENIANNLCFLALADFPEKRENFSNLFPEIEPKQFLKSIILTDFYQRNNNSVYRDLINGEKTEDTLILVCGATRMVNAYIFNETVVLPDDKVKFYEECLKFENVNSRYFWFLVRLLTHIVDDSSNKVFDLKKIKALKNEDVNFEAAYKETTFLQYDNFPESYDEFCQSLEIKS